MYTSHMKKVAVASKNPVKLNAVMEGFRQFFPDEEFEFEAVAVSSGVADQPASNEETLKGAFNRIENLVKAIDADYWVAIEGGIHLHGDEFEVIAWTVVKSKDGKVGKGSAASFFLPERVAKLIREGKELAHAADIVFNESKSNTKQGTVGLLTHNIITRSGYYVQPVILALVPFKNPHLY